MNEAKDAAFMQMLDLKRNQAPLLSNYTEPILKEINEKYAPLYELKM